MPLYTETLMDVLKPFAEACENLDESHRDGSPIWETSAAMSINAGDLRRAASTFKQISEISKAAKTDAVDARPRHYDRDGYCDNPARGY